MLLAPSSSFYIHVPSSVHDTNLTSSPVRLCSLVSQVAIDCGGPHCLCLQKAVFPRLVAKCLLVWRILSLCELIINDEQRRVWSGPTLHVKHHEISFVVALHLHSVNKIRF